MDLNELEFLEVKHISVQMPCDVAHLCSHLPAGQSKKGTEVAGLGLGSWILAAMSSAGVCSSSLLFAPALLQ